MSALTTKLATLNTLRANIGKAPLASWKNSMADLDQRIADLTPTPGAADILPAPLPQPDLTVVANAIADAVASGKVTKLPTGASAVAAAKKQAKADKRTATKPVAPTKPAKPAAKAKRTAPANVKASGPDFAAFLATNKIDGRVARAKLRRAGFSAPYDISDKKVIAALTGDKRKK